MHRNEQQQQQQQSVEMKRIQHEHILPAENARNGIARVLYANNTRVCSFANAPK